MPSDVIVASLIIGGAAASIAGSILYATRNRSMELQGTAYLGRKEDVLSKKLDELNKNLKEMSRK